MPVIPREERHKLDARCDLLVSDALAALTAFNGTVTPALWLPLAQREQFTYYRSIGPVITSPPHEPDGREQTLRFLVTGYLPGSLAQVTSGLYSDTTRALTLQQCVLLAGDSSNSNSTASDGGGNRRSTSAPASNGSDRRSSISSAKNESKALPAAGRSTLIDASVMYVSEQEYRRAPFRFAGTKWYAWRSQGVGGSSVERDLLAYERSGAVSLDSDDSGSYGSGGGGADDANGEVMYHVVQSVERAPQGADAARFPPGLRHMKLSVCYLYRQVCGDLVECFAIGEYPALRRGVASALQRTEDAAVADRVLIAAHALAAYSAKRLSRLIEKNSKLAVIMSKSCLRCSVRRTVFDPLRTCAICKKSVCQSCREERTIFKLNVDTNRPETETFCRKCISRSSLPVTVPATLEKIRRQLKLRRTSPERSRSSSQLQSWQRLSESNQQHAQQHRQRRASGASRGSSGSRDSVGSASALNAPSPMQLRPSCQGPANGKAAAPASGGGFNYDALFRHYAVEKPVATRSRASTLPESITGSSTSSGTVTASVVAEPVSDSDLAQQPVVALDAALEAEEVVLGEESLRATQLGHPVILVGVKSLRDTQLGVPVAIETGRVSEPSLHTTSHATFFGAAGSADDGNRGRDRGQQQRQSTRAAHVGSCTSPPPSPSRRSDLYVAPLEGGECGVERLYQTYLERRGKIETAAAGEQQLRHTRLQVARQHEQSRRSPSHDGSSSSTTAHSPHCFSAAPSEHASSSHTGDDTSANGAPHRSDMLERQQQQQHQQANRARRSEALPTKQHFHMDLYAQL